MKQVKYIIWVDNEIKKPEFKNRLEKLSEYNIIKISDPVEFLRFIRSEENDPVNTLCIILDISFPKPENEEFENVAGGTPVGEYLINQLKSQHSRYKNVLLVVHTVTKNPKIIELCKKYEIEYTLKRDAVIFVQKILELTKGLS